MSGENTKVYLPQGGDELVVADGGKITIQDGGKIAGPGPVIVSNDTAYSVKAENSGRVHIIPDLTSDCTFTLPSPEAGLAFTFVYGGVAADAADWIIDAGSDTNFYKGGLLYVDDAPAADSKAGDGDSNSKVTILTPEPGTRIHFECDGTNWYLSGVVASASAPTFADQS